VADLILDLPPPRALATGIILSLSSTAIVLQTLREKGLQQTPGGRSTFSVLLTQDIAVIPILILLPLLSFGAPIPEAPPTGEGAEKVKAALTLIAHLPNWAVTLVTLGVVLGIALTGLYLTRPVFRFVHKAHLRELSTVLALLIVVGIAL